MSPIDYSVPGDDGGGGSSTTGTTPIPWTLVGTVLDQGDYALSLAMECSTAGTGDVTGLLRYTNADGVQEVEVLLLSVAALGTGVAQLCVSLEAGSDVEYSTTHAGTGGSEVYTVLPLVRSAFLPRFSAKGFELYDGADNTKRIRIDASSVPTGSTRTIQMPSADGVLALAGAPAVPISLTQATPDGAAVLTLHSDPASAGPSNLLELYNASAALAAALSFAGDLVAHSIESADDANIGGTLYAGGDLYFDYDPGTGFGGLLQLSGVAVSLSTFILPLGGGTLVTTAVPATLNMISSTASSGSNFQDTTTGSKKLRIVLSGGVGNNSFTLSNTAARDYLFGNIGGRVPMVGANTGAAASGKIKALDLTAQAAAIASSNMTSSAPAGYYLVNYTLEVTTANVADVSVQFQVNYTDDVGATNQAGGVLVLSATGRDRGEFQVYLASGELSYQTNVVTQTTSRYALRVRATYLG